MALITSDCAAFRERRPRRVRAAGGRDADGPPPRIRTPPQPPPRPCALAGFPAGTPTCAAPVPSPTPLTPAWNRVHGHVHRRARPSRRWGRASRGKGRITGARTARQGRQMDPANRGMRGARGRRGWRARELLPRIIKRLTRASFLLGPSAACQQRPANAIREPQRIAQCPGMW